MVLAFWEARVECITTRRRPPEEECEWDGAAAKGKKTGRARRKCNFSCFFLGKDRGIGAFFPLFAHLFFLFCGLTGIRR